MTNFCPFSVKTGLITSKFDSKCYKLRPAASFSGYKNQCAARTVVWVWHAWFRPYFQTLTIQFGCNLKSESHVRKLIWSHSFWNIFFSERFSRFSLKSLLTSKKDFLLSVHTDPLKSVLIFLKLLFNMIKKVWGIGP